MQPSLIAAIDRLCDWYIERALPLWARVAVDPSGAFYETLDFSGRPIAGQPRRTRVQARQIHVFTEAALRGWLPAGEAIAAKGFTRFLETARPDGGARGCVHAIDDDGAVLDPTRDLYDQAFLLLAAASRIKASGDRRAHALAKTTLAFLDAELASPHGGYFEDDKRSLPRRQNPHMHLFEATMALYDATGDDAHLTRAREIEQLFRHRFFDRGAGALREFFDKDWTPDAGGRVEPGHMMEWVFLLDRFEHLTGEARGDEKRILYRSAKAMGAPDDAPFLPNAATPGQQPERSARRLWPQTEYLRAALVLARAGEAKAEEDARRLINTLFATYLDQKTEGLWQDEYDAEGRPAAEDVPASILYHIHEAVCAAAEYRHRPLR